MANPVSGAYRPKIFYGLSSEDGIEFVRQFELYCQIHELAIVEPAPDGQGNVPAPATTNAIIRFQICISGDAARWFADLPADQKVRWPVVKEYFQARYCNLMNDWAENVCLREIKQSPDMPVEVYINKLCDQARRMGKPLAACIPDLVCGLTYNIQKEVILRCPQTPDEVIQHAKLAEVVTNNGLKSILNEVKPVAKVLNQQGENMQKNKAQVQLVQYEQGFAGDSHSNFRPNNSSWRGRNENDNTSGSRGGNGFSFPGNCFKIVESTATGQLSVIGQDRTGGPLEVTAVGGPDGTLGEINLIVEEMEIEDQMFQEVVTIKGTIMGNGVPMGGLTTMADLEVHSHFKTKRGTQRTI